MKFLPICLIASLVVVVAGRVSAQTAYHDCSFCHVIHNAPGPALGIAEDQEVICLTCHGPAGTSTLVASVHENRTGGPFNFRMSCLDCHTPHSSLDNWLGGTNLAQVGRDLDGTGTARIQTPNSGLQEVVFESRGTDAGGLSLYSFADSDEDGNGVYDGVCETCHTQTQHHTSAAPDATHYTGQDCTACHQHANGFVVPPHLSTSDCSNCHLNPQTQEPDLFTPHAYDCGACHLSGFDTTILGPTGTWDGTCEDCHNPSVPETGSYPSPTKGHRCITCHGEPRSMSTSEHKRHAELANCVTCHGFIPEVGTEIGSGNRNICSVCHTNPNHGTSSRSFHQRHTGKGVSCLECHGDARPPVDVVSGPPVGSSPHVCRVCHMNRDPSDFQGNMEREHERHTKKGLDCGSCHLDANLQDDRVPMPVFDDPVRASLDRSGYQECAHCHAGGETGSAQEVHHRHLDGQWQWCYNCHENTDDRPPGLTGPVTQPSESCVLCHSNRTYNDVYPFDVHETHQKRALIKCYACHQLDPRIMEWPDHWRSFF